MHDFDKLFDDVDMSGIAWTTAREKPLVVEQAGETLYLWSHHHAVSGSSRLGCVRR